MPDTPAYLIEQMADEAYALFVHGVEPYEYKWYRDMYGEQ